MTNDRLISYTSIFLFSTYFVFDYIGYNYFKQEFDVIRSAWYCLFLFTISFLIYFLNLKVFKINNINNHVFILLFQIITFNSSRIEAALRKYIFGYEKIYLIIIYLVFIFFLISIFFICYKNFFKKKFLLSICLFLILNLIYNFYANFLRKEYLIKIDSNKYKISKNINFKIKNENTKYDKNIYFIVYDTKTDFETLKKISGYYPNSYEEKLKDLGFFIGKNVFSSSNITIPSMNNIMEMGNIFNGFDDIDLNFFKQIEKNYVTGENKLIKILKQNNYDYLFYKSGFAGYKECPISSDICFKNQNYLKEQDIVFLNKTPFLRIISFFLDENKYVKLFNPERFEIDNLTQMMNSEIISKNKFLFYIHANLPHPPFRYNSDCSNHKRDGEIDYENSSMYLSEYLKQYKCSEKQSLSLIEKILTFDKDPIIIVTSDHGAYFNFENMNPDIKKINENQIKQLLSVFYAVKLPKNFCSSLKLNRDLNNNIFLYLLECLEIIDILKLNKSATITGYPDWPNYNNIRKFDIENLY